MSLSWDLVSRSIEALSPVLLAVLSWLSFKVAHLIHAKANGGFDLR